MLASSPSTLAMCASDGRVGLVAEDGLIEEIMLLGWWFLNPRMYSATAPSSSSSCPVSSALRFSPLLSLRRSCSFASTA